MKLEFLFLADFANITDGKLNVIGEFSVIGSQIFPFEMDSIHIVAKVYLEEDLEREEITVNAELVDDNGNEILGAKQILNLPPFPQNILIRGPGIPAIFVLGTKGIKFNNPGLHQLHFYIDDQLGGTAYLNILQLENHAQDN